MVEKEEVEYNGVVFRRYPNSDNRSDREYYKPPTKEIKKGVEALHREVYKNECGEIPEGYHVHHKDGDTTNNDPSNLEIVTPQEHAELHDWEMPEEFQEKGVKAAKEWHKSEEGRRWHEKHWDESLGKIFEEPKTKDCDQCSEEFEYYTSARFCSNSCKSKHRRESGVDDEKRNCEICGDTFTVNKYRSTKTCSQSCSGKLTAKNRGDNI